MCNRFDTIPVMDKQAETQTDRQTDGQTEMTLLLLLSHVGTR